MTIRSIDTVTPFMCQHPPKNFSIDSGLTIGQVASLICSLHVLCQLVVTRLLRTILQISPDNINGRAIHPRRYGGLDNLSIGAAYLTVAWHFQHPVRKRT